MHRREKIMSVRCLVSGVLKSEDGGLQPLLYWLNFSGTFYMKDAVWTLYTDGERRYLSGVWYLENARMIG